MKIFVSLAFLIVILPSVSLGQDADRTDQVKSKSVKATKAAKFDRSKFALEGPIKKSVLASSAAVQQRLSKNAQKEKAPNLDIVPVSKSLIERPVEALLGKDSAVQDSAVRKNVPAQKLAGDTSQVKPAKSENPKVKPGLVKWHKDFETACAKSRQSGKPVLLFQLLGNLDQRFT